MKDQLILNESQLRNVIRETIVNILNEMDVKNFPETVGKWAATQGQNGNVTRSIMPNKWADKVNSKLAKSCGKKYHRPEDVENIVRHRAKTGRYGKEEDKRMQKSFDDNAD